MNKYVKPELLYENFELTQHIAGGCQLITNSTLSLVQAGCNASGTLTDAVFGGMTITNGFVTGDLDCTQQLPAEMYCYYAGANPLPIHTS